MLITSSVPHEVFPISRGPSLRKLLFVGDNRDGVNWGRAASIALSQLLSTSFEISDRVAGDLFDLSTADFGYVGGLLPANHYQFFRYLLLRQWRRSVSWYMRLEQLLGAKDFISENPAESVDNLLAHRHRNAALGRIYETANESDVMVVDGDGDIIFSTPPRRQTLFLLAMIELGVRLKKPVFLVNSMISDCPLTGRNQTTLAAARRLLLQCRAVCLRDFESLEYVRKEVPQANCTFIPDSLFSWFPVYADTASRPPMNGDFMLPYPEKEEYWGKLDFSRPYICIGGGALAGSQPQRSIQCYKRLIDAVRELGYAVYLTESDLPDFFLRQVGREVGIGTIPATTSILQAGAVLAHARLFISGRYHPSILASLGGTPCIFLGSHAHKMSSLSRVLEYGLHRQFNAFPDHDEVGEIVSSAKSYIDEGEGLRARIKHIAKRRCDEALQLPSFLTRCMNS